MGEKIPNISVENNQAKVKNGMGLDFWAKEQLDRGLITEEVFKKFIEENNNKEENLRKHDLPQLKHYGVFNSIDEIEKIKPNENERYIIRCKSKNNQEIKRLLDATLEEAVKFAKSLPGGFDAWTVELKEFTKTIMAGTIIVEPSGRTIIETWNGPHYLNTTNDTVKYSGEFDGNKFVWKSPVSEGVETTDFDDAKIYAINALRYLFPNLQPHQNDPVYAEYAVKPNGEIYFIEVSKSPLMTGRFGVPHEIDSE